MKQHIYALQDQYFLARKKDFEKNFKQAIYCDPDLTIKYGNLWQKIAENREQASKIAKELYALTISTTYSPKYFFIARDLIRLAEQLQST